MSQKNYRAKSAALTPSPGKATCSLGQELQQGREWLRPSIIWNRNEGGMRDHVSADKPEPRYTSSYLCVLNPPGFSILPPMWKCFSLPLSFQAATLSGSSKRALQGQISSPPTPISRGVVQCVPQHRTACQGRVQVGAGTFSSSVLTWLPCALCSKPIQCPGIMKPAGFQSPLLWPQDACEHKSSRSEQLFTQLEAKEERVVISPPGTAWAKAVGDLVSWLIQVGGKGCSSLCPQPRRCLTHP